MNSYAIYYAILDKPSFAPPMWLFGPVWTILYIIIAITFFRVFYLALKRTIPAKVAGPFVLNLIFNAMFTWLQFGLQNNYLAALDILCIWVSIIAMMQQIWPYSRRLAMWQIPYFLWVSFATVLQLSIMVMNS